MNGIKQPLRFYDTTEKQNFRRHWANDAGLENAQTLICTENSIVPFQIRRAKSLNTVVLFDLYSWNGNDFDLDINLFTIIPVPTTNHLRIYQTGSADNIIWNPQLPFTSNLPCGLHYVHLSDGVNNWYSEVFRTIEGFSDIKKNYLDVGVIEIGIVDNAVIDWDGGTEQLIIHNKPF